MVRLLLQWVENHPHPIERFNPTMVRLLPYSERIFVCWAAKFQSHNGAIAADEPH